MKKISAYLLEHKWGYAFAVSSMIISIVLDMMSPQLTRHIIDDVILGGERDKLVWLLLGIFLIGLGRCIFQYTKEYTFDVLGTGIARDMRKNLFIQIQSLSTDFFDKNNTGELMARVKDDIDRIWDALTYISMLILEVGIHTCIVLFCMYRLNWKLALIPTACMIFCGSVAIIMERKLGVIYEEISEENAALNNVAEENLAGVRTVKAFAREKYEIKKFLSHNRRYYDLNMKQSFVFVKYYPLFQLVTKLLPVCTLLLGGRLVIAEQMTLGSLGAFVEYSMNIVWPMEMLGWLSNGFSSAIASNRKIKKLYEEKPAIREAKDPEILERVQGDIRFEHVSFWKEDQHLILKDISFHLKPGQTLGIIGATGSGKSSLVYLLQRLYDATQGQILLDGVDIKNLSLKQLRGNISLVMQDIFLFSDSIQENIRFGKKDQVTMDEVKRASHIAHAETFIEHMDDSYETVIGERGIGLSGGQKQRISIARAISKQNPILILDDSTSALDMETEHSIWETLNERKNETKIIIAHRISAVCKADEILVLEDGCVKERGTHQALLEKKGLYHSTYLAQYGQERRA